MTLTRACMFVLLMTTSVSAADRPNILFIFADDHAYQAVSAYGGRLAKAAPTPNIDRLANEGMLFRQCYVTNSICGPMRAVIQTGKHSHLNGFFQNGDKFDGTQQTFPKLLQKVGYQTAVIGKWHLGEHMAPQGYDYSHVLVGQGPYYNPPMLKDADGDGKSDGRTANPGYTTDVITNHALKWLKEGRSDDKPFMLMVQHKAPHREWSPGPDHLDTFDSVEFAEPKNLFEDYKKQVKARQTQTMQIHGHMSMGYDLKVDWAPGNLTPEQKAVYLKSFADENEAFKNAKLEGDALARWKYQRYLKIYLACIRGVDDNVGRILNYLDETGLAKNTVVIYTSDQGFYLGEHGWFDKRWVYEESLRTPMLVRWPETITPGSVNSDIVSPLDFAQTFLDIAGAEQPDDMQGQSLVPVMKGNTPSDWRKSHYYHYYEWPGAHMVRRHYAVVDGRYKLVHFYEDEVDEWELIDLKADPLEVKNFYGEPSYKETQSKLKAELDRLRSHYKVPLKDPPESIRQRGPRPKKIDRKKIAKIKLKQVFAEKDGKKVSTSKLDPSATSLTIGARCVPKGDGVLIAHGGASQGYSLMIKDGKPMFMIRANDELKTVVGPKAVADGKPLHLVGVLDARGNLHLYVNGSKAASAKGHFISSKPHDGLTVGQDGGSIVGDYGGGMPLRGSLSDVRVYIGVMDDAGIAKWAGK